MRLLFDLTRCSVFIGLCVFLGAAPAKEREWANIISCHESEAAAYTWSFEKKALGKYKLFNPKLNKSNVKV